MRLSQVDSQKGSQDSRGYLIQNNQISTHNFTLAQIIKDLDSKTTEPLNLFMRSVLTLKLQEINKQNLSQQENQQTKKISTENCNLLWRFVEKKFRLLYSKQNNEEESKYLIDVIALIVTKLKAQDFSIKLLNDVYYNFEEDDILNVSPTISALSKGILPIKEWEKRFSSFVRDAPGSLIEKVVIFLVSFADSPVIRSLIESATSENKFPNLLKITKELEKSTEQDPNQEMLTD